MEWYQNPRAAPGAAYDGSLDDVLGLAQCADAARSIAACPKYLPTPLLRIDKIGPVGAQIYFKDESSRFALGSFKALGGVYAVLQTVAARLSTSTATGLELFGQPAWQIVADELTFTCATDGNHGRAVAAGARLAGAKAVVFVHEGVDPRRVARISEAGAEIRVVRGHYDAGVNAAASASREFGWTLISDTCDDRSYGSAPLVMQGYSVVIQEAVRQAREAAQIPPSQSPFTHVFAQAGVGGLAGAAAAWLWQTFENARPRIIVVEPAASDCLMQSARNGRTSPGRGDLNTTMAMLACGSPSSLAWNVLRSTADFFMTVSDETASVAVRKLRDQGIATTTSGACGAAGYLEAAASPELRDVLALGPQSRVLLIGTEGPNDDTAKATA